MILWLKQAFCKHEWVVEHQLVQNERGIYRSVKYVCFVTNVQKWLCERRTHYFSKKRLTCL